jgi:hypothetical protein
MTDTVYVENEGVHDQTSHAGAPEKDKSKCLKLHQIETVRSGVVTATKQSAKHLCRNLMHESPEKRVPPELGRSVERHVRKFRAKPTDAKLDRNSVDDSYGSLVALVDAKWFTTMLADHNHPESE